MISLIAPVQIVALSTATILAIICLTSVVRESSAGGRLSRERAPKEGPKFVRASWRKSSLDSEVWAADVNVGGEIFQIAVFPGRGPLKTEVDNGLEGSSPPDEVV